MRPAAALAGRRVAVIGAGWAGLSAGLALQACGAEVVVYEAARLAGGRARRVDAAAGFAAPLDNGQHILLGAYTETLALMAGLGVAPAQRLLRLPLRLERLDRSFALRAPRLPAPWHAAFALLGARGLTWPARLAAVRFVHALRRRAWRAQARTVADLLARERQPAALVQGLWRPLCLAALNTEPAEACAGLFCAVLRDALDAPRAHSDLLLPRADLSALWPDAAAARLAVRYGAPVRRLAPGIDAIEVEGAAYDAAVLAVPPDSAARLLESVPGAQALRQALEGYDYRPIATLTVRLDGPVPLDAPILMLNDDAHAQRHGQWLFDRSRLFGLPGPGAELTVVASDAGALAALPREQARAALLAQLHAELPGLPPVIADQLLIDKRATFAATPRLARPGARTPWPRLALAGDWTDTGYPGVLEGAVRSGRLAAEALAAAAATF
ncbi:amine oxidoreductase [Verticiella sediminum]|uniref:Amine oxidoreductase n=1 Tax=Verticiella sediminum TaxID=1247510 RepID=A0A556AD11_9BURK|nr:hydroxysqualene dehydroxylase HpnE [Verticiella sediminum]TSH90767.1 amine oxidoreductase [Verticiella sediminum]